MYVEIDDKAFDGLDDELKAQFKQYTPEDTSGLKNKANELLNEKKALDAKLLQAEAELKEAKLSKPNSKSDEIQAQLDDALSKLNQKNEELTTLTASINQGKVNTEALKLAGQLTKDTAKAELLAEKFANRLKYDDGNISVLNKEGQPTISKPEELIPEFKERFAFLVDGNPASGGGVPGGSGEAAKAKQVTRQDFDAMNHAKRAAFVRDGGKVVA